MRVTKTFTNKRAFNKFADPSNAYTDDGKVWRWVSNDSVIMLEVCKDYDIPCDPVLQEEARFKELNEWIESYRKNQPETPSYEEVCEARAAFGPGKNVVDVISGRKFTT